MTAAPLVKAVHDAGGRLAIAGRKLKVSAPAPLPDALVSELRAHKAELIELLACAESWDAETRALIEWFMETSPPAEPFELYQAVTVINPTLVWEALRGDIAAGPGVGRAYTGALQKDLWRLYELFAGPKL